MTKAVKRNGAKRLLLFALALSLGTPLFALLHNVFHALAMMAGDIEILSRVLNGLNVASFGMALFVCPAGAGICFAAAAIKWLFAGSPSWLRGGLMVLVPAMAAVLAISILTQNRMSLREVDEAAGLNGSFEVASNGLPVNWWVYRQPLDAGDAEVFVDPADHVDGEQSLRVVVHPDRERPQRPPGIFQTIDAEQGRTYDVSLRIKTHGSTVRLMVTSESPRTQEGLTPIVESIPANATLDDQWRRLAYEYTVPPPYENIRLELAAIGPGAVWIDDVRIEARPLGR